MISNKTKLIIGFAIVLTTIIGFNMDLKSKNSQLLDENQVKAAYQNSLVKENKDAEKMFGKLAQKDAGIQLTDFSLKECTEQSKSYECIVSVTIKTFRGEKKEKEKIEIQSDNNQYIITNKIKVI